MTPDEKAMIEKLEALNIGLDETFEFHCTECGKCCKHRDDILLTPRDVYSISKELNMSIKEFIAEYCKVYIGDNSHVPITRLLPRGNVQRCTFLENNKCLIHNVKPTICAMYPIGRSLNFLTGETKYVFTNPDCGDKSETYTVREWLEKFNIYIDDEFQKLWGETIYKISNTFNMLYEKHLIGIINVFENAAFVIIYNSYDLSLDFMNQFKENRDKLYKLIDEVTESFGIV